eukprot:TRINITY_DN3851_c0_g1_i1.p1 TRINITY_DN3851_c0_g1~~TRINITY_DN3851_c0_g1_i1.p1  ORF type:complete len:344 (-),score=80.27 TRINITY_DN3851_c0_g1_i1:24-1055(-)
MVKPVLFFLVSSTAAAFVITPVNRSPASLSYMAGADQAADSKASEAPPLPVAKFMGAAVIGAGLAMLRRAGYSCLGCQCQGCCKGSPGCQCQGCSRGSRTSLRAVYGEPRKVEIIPSVLPADFGKLGEECKRLEDAGVDRIQFDVMDGNFVPNLTFGPDVIAYMKKYCSVKFETQLMVEQRCLDYMLPQFVEATNQPNKPGVTIVHVEAATHLHRNLSQIRAAGGSPSVALNPHTPAEMVENVLDMVDHVLVMTVNPGFGGQAYIPTMLDKIRKIRKWIVDRNLDVDIEVDGGIKGDKTIAECADAGANCFIAGSGLFAYDDLSKGVEELRSVAQAGQKGEIP